MPRTRVCRLADGVGQRLEQLLRGEQRAQARERRDGGGQLGDAVARHVQPLECAQLTHARRHAVQRVLTQVQMLRTCNGVQVYCIVLVDSRICSIGTWNKKKQKERRKTLSVRAVQSASARPSCSGGCGCRR